MKKTLSVATALFLIFVFTATVSFAQDIAFQNDLPKETLLNLISSENNTANTKGTVSIADNARLQKSFNKLFQNASGVRWYSLKKDFFADFEQNGRKTWALFAKNGYFMYSVAYGTEKDLPKSDRRAIKSMYVDYDILSAIEVRCPEAKHTTWLAALKDEDNYVIARVINGGVDEYARFDTHPKEKKLRKGRVLIPKD